MKKLIDLDSGYFKYTANILLEDKTTKKNITWSTKTYEHLGDGYTENAPVERAQITGVNSYIIQPRVYKSQTEQAERTKKKAEVFTPTWLCNKMNNFCDEEWFGRKGVFNTENEDNTWTVNPEKIEFSGKKTWKHYVDSRRLEITCGEAPYLVSRYDATTGEIIPLENRIGVLDRKMRVVNENATDEEWMKWTIRAFQSTYGYEYQGDNLLIARVNMLMSFVDYYENKWSNIPEAKETMKLANIIAWNLWQMDGLKGIVPQIIPEKEEPQISFDNFSEQENTAQDKETECKYMNWRKDNSFLYSTLKEGKMKFDFVIGNPPYQEQSTGDKPSDESIYNYFMDASYEIAENVELITPARFLFNAGATPKKWNEDMLNDPHFKVLNYEMNSAKVFSNTDIKGGVAIHYRSSSKNFGAIGTFTAYNELNSILKKVRAKDSSSLTTIIYNQHKFNLSNLYADYPELQSVISSNGREKRMTSGCISYDCFHDEKQSDEDVRILGVIKNKRKYRYIHQKYLEVPNENIFKYKVIVPANNGSGAIGEVLSTPLIGEPLIGYTQTFIAVGAFDSNFEAEAALKYVKSKFCRTMLGILKITQNGKRETWRYVPLPDFTENSDINWSVSVKEIDQQLYEKYGLSVDEIAFIETKVKEME